MQTLTQNFQNPLLTVSLDTPATSVIHLMNQEQVGYALVLNHQQLAGIFTERDVVNAIASKANLETTAIADLMTAPAITINETELQNISLVLERLRQHPTCHLPIVNEQGQVTGIATPSDVYAIIATLQQTISEQRIEREREVAQRQQLETRLAEAEARYCTTEAKLTNILNNANASICCFRLFPDGRLIDDYFSEGCRAITGYSPEELLAEDLWSARMSADDWNQMLPILLEHLFAERSVTLEYRFRHRDGTLRWFSSAYAGRLAPSGDYVIATVIDTDITDRKRAEIALQENESRFRAVFEQAAVGIGEIALSGYYLNLNQRYCDILGYTKAELLERTYQELTHPDDQSITAECMVQLLAGTTPTVSLEKRYIRKDGQVQWTKVAVSLVRDKFEVPQYAICVIEDIQERKLAEAKLRKSEADLAAAQRIAHIGNWEFDVATQKITWSDETFRIFGLEPTQPALTYSEMIRLSHPDDREQVHAAIAHTVATGLPTHSEYRVLQSNGAIRHIEVRREAILDDQGTVIKLFGTTLDITDRKQLEVALRASQRKFNDILNSAIASISSFRLYLDRHFEYEYFSAGCETVFGYTPAELMADRTLWISRVPPEDIERAIKPSWENVIAERTHHKEYRFRHKDGTLRWILATVTSRRDDEQDCWIVTAVDTDITDRKHIEENLRESEERLTIALKAGKLGSWQLDLKTNELTSSEQCKANFGLPPDADLSYERFYEFIHPDDRVGVSQAVQYAVEQRTDYQFEFRTIWDDGSLHWIMARGRGVYEPDGTPSRMIGVSFDLTQRKQIEEALREKEEQLRLALDFTNIGLWDWYIEDNRLLWNENTARLMDLPSNMLVVEPQDWESRVHPDDLDRILREAEHALATNSDYESEYRVIWSDGTIRWILDRARGIYDATGKAIRMIGCVLDISDRKVAESALIASEARFRTIFEQAAVGIAYTTPDGQYLFVNQKLCDIVGYTIDEMLAQTFRDITYPDDLAADLNYMEQLLAGEISVFSMEKRFIRKDGTVIWGQITISSVKDDAGQISCFLGITQDISNRKHAEAALRESEERFRQLAENIDQVFFIETADSEKVLYVNPAYEAIWGRSCQDLYEQPNTWIESVHPDDRQQLLDAIAQQRLAKQFKVEYRILRPDGSVRWISARTSIVLNQTNQILHRVGIADDITERKQFELALRESEERFREIAETIEDVFFVNSPDASQILYLSPMSDIVWGLSRDYLYQEPHAWMELVHPADRDWVLAAFNRQAQGEPYQAEYRIIRPDGSMRWLFDRTFPVFDETGQLLRHVGIVSDITDRKQTEAALAQEIRRRKALLDASVDGIIALDQEGNVIEANPSFANMLGYSLEETAALNLTDWDAEWTGDELRQKMAELALCSNTFQTRHRRKDGSIYDVEVSANSVNWDGQIVQLCICRDITERKQAQAALAESEEKFRQVAASIREVFWMTDATGDNVLYISPSYERIWGYPLDYLYQNPMSWIDAVVPDDRERVEAVWASMLSAKEFEMEYQIQRPDGTRRWIRDQGSAIYNDKGEIYRFGGILEDITDRKQAEEALRESEERFRQLAENINDVFFIETPDGDRTLYVSPAFERIWGYPCKSLYEQPQDWIESIHPDDRNLVLACMDAQKRGEPTQKEYRVVRHDGELRWIFSRTFPIFDETGCLLRHVGLAEDVTQRKQVEQTLRQQREVLQTIVDNVPAMLALIAPDGNLHWVNREWETVLGWTFDEIKSCNVLEELYPDPDDREFVREFVHSATRTWGDFKTRTRDGRVIDTTWANVMLSDGGSLGIGQDITDRKQAETRIRTSLREKEALLQEIHHRVKNNLQIISSLLNLQANRVSDPQIRRILEDSWSRVDSMALVHESLYRSNDFSSIDFAQYIQTLTLNLFRIYNIEPDRIARNILVDSNIPLTIDQAIPCGLIINELVTNALKHGFQDNQSGTLTITLSMQIEQTIVLTVSNSGNTLPANLSLHHLDTSQSMGLRLVMSLVEQLEGTLSLERGDPTTFRVTFEPSNEYEDDV